MPDPILNTLVTFVWLVALLLWVVRHMEVKGFRFEYNQIDNGLEFRYKLGVYAGTVRLVRDPDATEPHVVANVFGWEFRFPTSFTNREMLDYAHYCGPHCHKGQSHSKDLMIFNEVVNNHNDGLISINGNIYVYDKSDNRPYRAR